MMNNRCLLPAIVLTLIIVSGMWALVACGSETRSGEIQSTMSEESLLNPDFSFEHITGDAVVDFDDGCEYFLDESLLPYLERLEMGVPATDEAGNYYLNADGKINIRDLGLLQQYLNGWDVELK